MTARKPLPIPEAIRKAVEGLDHTDTGMWLYDVTKAVFRPYSCNDPERCEGRPAWDKAESEMFERLSNELEEAFVTFLTDRLTPEFERYAAAYPDAPRVLPATAKGKAR